MPTNTYDRRMYMQDTLSVEMTNDEIESLSEDDRVYTVGLLLDGAINFVQRSRAELSIGNINGKVKYIDKATSIIKYLSDVIIMEGGIVSSENLKNLCSFVMDKLFDANVNNNEIAYDDVERILFVLRNTWYEMVEAQ